MLIGEQSNRTITKIKSWDVNFIEYEFSSRVEVDKSLKLHEIVDHEKVGPSGLVENREEIPQAPANFENNLSPNMSILLVNQP